MLTTTAFLALFLSYLPTQSLAQSPTATAPLIINQGPTARCYGWYSEPTSNGYPPTSEQSSCAGANMYGRFTLADYGWHYPSEYNTSPGFAGSVNGANNSPLSISLTNNATGAKCSRALEVNLSFDYPGSALYSNISSTDLSQYDTIMIEYDVTIVSATTTQSGCSCQSNGSPTCPTSYWRSWLTTDILFYQGASSSAQGQSFNALSIRNFDPQNAGTYTWNTSDGYRVQTSDHQIPSQAGTSAHVSVDAKYLMREYASQLCQGSGSSATSLRGPIYLRSIQFVLVNVGTDMTVELSNVKANAYKYAPGQFTPKAVTDGPTPSYCPASGGGGGSPTTRSSGSGSGPTQTPYGQCGGQAWTGPTICTSGWECEEQNQYYSQCLQG